MKLFGLLSRRTILKGLGISVSLPWLEAMGPFATWANASPSQNITPNRMAFLYVPNGKNMPEWTPKSEGADFEKLKATKEGEGNLLDHLMIAYGSGNSDVNAHNHDDFPILLAGGGYGTLSSGRHLRFSKETPPNNLWLSMLNRMDINIDRLGDSTGALASLK
jgi:hypothetical protein